MNKVTYLYATDSAREDWKCRYREARALIRFHASERRISFLQATLHFTAVDFPRHAQQVAALRQREMRPLYELYTAQEFWRGISRSGRYTLENTKRRAGRRPVMRVVPNSFIIDRPRLP